MQHDESEETIVEMPIDGTIDLHTFHPKDIKDLIPVYLDECLARGMEEIRIIHGKGKGVLRRIVHSILDRHPSVVSYKYGRSWGDTIVILRRNTD
jgi:dsDNA-specific endonuclease/ATPase MutS2